MRAQAVWIAVLAALLALAAAALPGCGNEARRAGHGPVLRVGVYENPPKIYTDGQGRSAGLVVELVDAIAREEAWQLEYRRCEWNACLHQLQAGQLDLMPDVAYSAERSRQFDFHAIPVTYSWSQVFAHSGIEL